MSHEHDPFPESAPRPRPARARASAGRGRTTRIDLNLVTSYPVRWSRFDVLRDFVQNFFDAVGPGEFARRVQWTFDGRRAEIRATGVSFGYEWLVAIGASTKTSSSAGQYAGYFGEGFKVAALCAHRDHHWQVSAGSRDWSIAVTTTPLVVDARRLESLAYHLHQSGEVSDSCWLAIDGLDTRDVDLLRTSVPWSFCYPENPLLGEPLLVASRVSEWRRSTKPLPQEYPRSRTDGEGILFAAHQARGTHPLPFALAVHDHRDHDRERRPLYDFEVVEAIAGLATQLDAPTAAVLLESLRPHWSTYPRRRHQVGSWNGPVRILARQVARDPPARAAWCARHPGLLVVERVTRGDVRAGNRRRQALAWSRRLDRTELVQEAFSELGYSTLESACERAGGFARLREPTPLERRRLALLVELVTHHFRDLLPPEHLPPVLVIESQSSAWSGIATCRRLGSTQRTVSGRRLRFHLEGVGIDAGRLAAGHPASALATLLHELAHQYGTEESRGFAGALTDLLERMAVCGESLVTMERQWAEGSG